LFSTFQPFDVNTDLARIAIDRQLIGLISIYIVAAAAGRAVSKHNSNNSSLQFRE